MKIFSLTCGKIVNTLSEGADTDNQLACYDPGKPLLNVKLHHHDRELSTNYLGH